MAKLKIKNSEFGLTFVDDKEISFLNRKYLGRRGPTDVVSFPMDDPNCLGDVVISVDTLRRQAKQHKVKINDELMFLVVHGILHLLGFDHVKKKDRMIMQKMEQELLK